MHVIPEAPGRILKAARERAGITMETLANRVDISERYLYRIENENQKPSYDVLYRLVRELEVSPELIFFPEKPCIDSEVDHLLRKLCKCDSRALKVVEATAEALINTAHEKQP